ncbi:MAG: T9SS type A sorting domain-containing protein [Bacteroidales bacterium]|nr:T9SS type A sorting domain-containing protein [Bacteroidales bacterium]
MRAKILTIVSVLILSFCFTYVKAQYTLFVKEKTGTQTPYAIAGIKKLTFASGNMIVNKENGNTTSYELDSLCYLNFGNNLYTGIPTIGAERNSAITLYPNPVNDQLHIQYESATTEDIQLKITDILGRLVLQKTISSHSGTNEITIPVEQLPQGLYLCSLRNGNKLEINKFLKQ